MPDTTVWILTVALFAHEQSTTQNTQEFTDLHACVAASQQLIREFEQQPHGQHEHLTAACVPKT